MSCPYCGNVTPLALGSLRFGFGAYGFISPKCSRAMYVVLGLFLGGLGIHNFVAGRVGHGVAQLLITVLLGWLVVPLLLVGLWVVLEICIVDTDGNGVRMS